MVLQTLVYGILVGTKYNAEDYFDSAFVSYRSDGMGGEGHYLGRQLCIDNNI